MSRSELWEIPKYVGVELSDWKEPLGIEPNTLLTYGLAWSLTTLKHREWDASSIEESFLPEIRHFEKMMAYRRVDLAGFQSKLQVDNEFVPKS